MFIDTGVTENFNITHTKSANNMTVKLIREKTNHQSPMTNRAVHGSITLPFETPLNYPTLENADFLIPAGIYPLKMTWSPRFKKMMPEICDVPEREGIRIHMGTKPEHSEGCVLVSAEALENTKSLINLHNKYYSDEELELKIEN